MGVLLLVHVFAAGTSLLPVEYRQPAMAYLEHVAIPGDRSKFSYFALNSVQNFNCCSLVA